MRWFALVSQWRAPAQASERQGESERESWGPLRVKERIYSEGKIWKPSKIQHHFVPSFVCLFVFFFFFFFYNTQYYAVLLKKIKIITQWNGVICRITKPLKDMQIISVRFGSAGNRFWALWFNECTASESEVHLSSDHQHRLHQSMAAAVRDDRRQSIGSMIASLRSLLVISPNLNPKLKFYFFAHLWQVITTSHFKICYKNVTDIAYIYIYRFLAWIHWPVSIQVSVSSSCRIEVGVFN